MERVERLIQPVLAVIVAGLVAWLITTALGWLVRRARDQTRRLVWEVLHRRCRRPLRATLVTAAVLIALPDIRLSDRATDIVRHVVVIAFIAAVCWLLLELTGVVEDLTVARVFTELDPSLRDRAADLERVRRDILGAAGDR
jgi:hypothetical protein